MARILLCAAPLTSVMNHSLTFARRLRARGHDILFFGMPDCAPYLKDSGFPLETVYEDWFPPGTVGEWLVSEARSPLEQLKATWHATRDVRRHLVFLADGGHQLFTNKVRALRPDLILVLSELHPNWALLAHHSGVPSVYLSCMLPMIEQPGLPPLGVDLIPAASRWGTLATTFSWQQQLFTQYLEDRALGLVVGMPRWVDLLQRLSLRLGNPPDFLETRALMPVIKLPQLIMCPEIFEFPRPVPSPLVRYIEPCIDLERSPGSFDLSRLRPELSLAYCSLGSIVSVQRFNRAVIEAFRQLPQWQLVLTVGPHTDPAQLENVPPNVIVAQQAPQLALLARARIFLTHAGMASMMEALYFGVPMLLYPFGADQPGVAARAVHHGVGRLRSIQNARAEDIRADVEAVASDATMRAQAERMQRVLRDYEQQMPGIQWLERLLGAPS